MALEEAPPFWWKKPGLAAVALSPAAFAYGWWTARRMEQPPVLCVGNLIAGGAGKTPTALALCEALKERGLKPGFLTRGHGGVLRGPVAVQPGHHTAASVGDEPLLLARSATTVVSVDRPEGARMLVAKGCNFIVMDDGFQNPSLEKDFSLLVIDSGRGIGNGKVIPAGPLRAPLQRQLLRAQAVVVIGGASGGDRVIREAARGALPIQLARTVAVNEGDFAGRKLLAFAGIADPTKFFASLEQCGAQVEQRRGFGDHHVYRKEEAAELLETATAQGLELATTSKDMARLAGAHGKAGELAAAARVLEIRLEFDDPRGADLIIDKALDNYRRRLLRGK
jgi:tetraacyldisaccharide 4'-kinase